MILTKSAMSLPSSGLRSSPFVIFPLKSISGGDVPPLADFDFDNKETTMSPL